MSSADNTSAKPTPPEPEDYYMEDGMMVFTAAYHLKRGVCCGSGCRHCPYGVDEQKRVREENRRYEI